MTQAMILGTRPRPLSPILVLFLLAGFVLLPGCGPRTRRPAEFNVAMVKARANKIAEAQALLDKVAARAAGKSEQHGRELARLRQQVATYARVHKELDAELERDLGRMSRNKVESYYLDTKRHQKMERFREEAFRYRLSHLNDWMDEIQQRGRPDPASGPAGQMRERVSDDLSEEEMTGDTTGVLFDEVAELCDEGDFATALEKLREEMPRAGKNSDRVRKELWRVEDLGFAKAKELESKARQMAAEGKTRQAIAWLAVQSRGYPLLGRLSLPHEVRREFEQVLRTDMGVARKRTARIPADDTTGDAGEEHEAVAGAPRKSEPATPVESPVKTADGLLGLEKLRQMSMSDLRAARTGLLTEARQKAVVHDFQASALDYKQVALICKLQAPWLTSRYEAQAEQVQLMADAMVAFQKSVKHSPRDYRSVDIGVGHKVELIAVEDQSLRFRGEEGPEDWPLSRVSDANLALLLVPSAKTGRQRLGAALIADRGGRREEAEKLLYKVLKEDASLKPEIDRIVARMREEKVGEEGYVIEKGKFVSVAAVKRKKLLAAFNKAFSSVLNRSTDEGRELAYKKVLENAELKPFLADGLEAEKKKLFDRLSKASFKGSYEKLAALRVELDKRRAFAKELIFDAVKYFYPYRPPAVSGEKAAEYREVQKEVDARVAAVREIWDGKQVSITLPGKVQKDIDHYRWLTKKLNDLGRFQSEMDAKLTLLSAKAGAMDIRNFAENEKDRKFLDRGDEILAANEKLFAERIPKGEISREQADQIRITNAYRRMFGHRPLRCDLRLMEAASGHSEEMNRLGYFSHTSPTPGRRSPGDRMRLAKYPGGGGENIAINGSPQGAHVAWIHSSGHHRNLLNAHHRDMGIGVVGRYYTQNFGSAGGGR